jgi:phosphohistidine phosphatase
MRTLILMRHAKSSWDDATQKDIDRPLNKRGRNAATLLGRWLRQKGYQPDFALISVAERTRETWAGVVAETGDRPARFVPELYEAGPEVMLRVLRKAPDVGTVLMLGHLPGIGAFARKLLREPPDTVDFTRFPTAATAVIAFDLPDWSDVDWSTGDLTDFAVPKQLAEN